MCLMAFLFTTTAHHPEAHSGSRGPEFLGGGVPVRGGNRPECGVNSYAGYTCPSGQRICNPLIFGVQKSSEAPVCFPCASMKTCFDEINVGVDTELTPVFAKPEIKKTYNSLARVVKRHCRTKKGQYVEGPLGEDCKMFYGQFTGNHKKPIDDGFKNLYAGTFVSADPEEEVATETVVETVSDNPELTAAIDQSEPVDALKTNENIVEVEKEAVETATVATKNTEPEAEVKAPASLKSSEPPAPPPLHQVHFQRCYQKLNQLRDVVGSEALDKIIGNWSLVEGRASKKTLRNFTVSVDNDRLTLSAMGMVFKNATICMSQPEGYFRLHVRSLFVNTEVDVRLPKTNTLVSYNKDGSHLTYRRHSISSALERSTAKANKGVL